MSHIGPKLDVMPRSRTLSESRGGRSRWKLNIIVVGYKGDRWLPACIDSLRESVSDGERIILVDNHGNECVGNLNLRGEIDYIIKLPRPMGFAEANNFALVHGGMDADYVCFLNQDTVGERGWIHKCLACMDRRPEIGAVMPLILDYAMARWERWFLECAARNPEFNPQTAGSEADRFWEVGELTAACLIARTAALELSGPFDPIYESYYEDFDLCRRIAKAGYVTGICGGARIGHDTGSATTTPAAESRRRRLIIRNRAIYRARHQGEGRARELAKIVGAVPRGLLRSAVGRAGAPPMTVFLHAHADLCRLGRRIWSASCDEEIWKAYLKEIGWDEEVRMRGMTEGKGAVK